MNTMTVSLQSTIASSEMTLMYHCTLNLLVAGMIQMNHTESKGKVVPVLN